MTSSARDVVVGIDLGTTNSLLGVMIDGRPHVLPDDTGEDLLPSVVASDGAGGVLVGRAAKNRRLVDPAETVVSVKRAMGSSASFRVSERSLSAAQVSALILGALLDRAEKKLGSRPTRAVITVPAFFDDAQRQATRDAGAIAGLTVERLVNEPTAAALTFQTGAEELVAVYDFGGGTFDVSVLERDEGLLEVRASRGDTKLGGDDLDAALTALVLARFGDKRAAIERDPRAMTRLVEAVERAKIALSDRDEARLVDPFLTGEGASAVHLDTLLTRAEVEAVAKPFLERTLRCIDDALRDAKAKPSDLHRVLLVGGSSKMPLVARMVAAHLGRPVHSELDADRAVAIGATLLGGRIGGVAVAEVLVDITPHTLAAGVLDASSDANDDGSDDLVAVPIIPRDTTVPVERKRTFYTMIEDQPGVDVPITQGEEHYTDDNTLLGSVRVEKLPSSPAGSPIDVVFRLDLSGVLTVRATHVASGTKAEVSIVDSPYRLTDQRRRESREEIEQLRAVGRAANDVASTGPSDTDLALAKAMLSRAGKAIVTKREATRDGDDAAILAKATGAADALRGAIETRASDLMERIDAVSDALLDLM